MSSEGLPRMGTADLAPGKLPPRANMAATEQLTWEALEPKGCLVPRKVAQLGEPLMKVLVLGLYVAKGVGTYSYSGAGA